MVGIAAGLADSGYNVFAATFANFAALRANEFVRHFMGYMRSPIKLVGFGAGFAMEFFGATHYGVEDVAALRSISNIAIISPADGLETVKATEALSKYDGPAYLRLTGTANNPAVYKSDYDFTIGKAVALKKGKDVAIAATGSMTFYALEASKILEADDIQCAVIDMHTIKPMDTEAIDCLLDVNLLVSVEEHNTIGGLGSAIAEYVSEKKNAPATLRLGVSQGYKKAGAYKYMLEQNALTAVQIANAVRSKL
jgi:transketolase